MVTGSMRLINVHAFLEREKLFDPEKQVELFDPEKPVECQTEVLEWHDDEDSKITYAILSHRWIGTEIHYEEMVDLGKMNTKQQKEIRDRQGYKKVVATCKQAEEDNCKWVWVDTCCMDKRNGAELQESMNSMYRWYANAKICYAYLHDVDGSSFPDKVDKKYHKSNGRPEWFSRGWTLQEMIAPQILRFFNKDWKPIGDRKWLAPTLEKITGVPVNILQHGLEGNRPCIAQIMSWAANRKTKRVEDRAYSLMGLLDVNMPTVYGEGKKAFHRLQLEIIRSSTDQSIFAWGHDSENVRIGSILADSPSDFKDCSTMELMEHDEFIEEFPELSLTGAQDLDVFPITNRGIHIWMVLRPYPDSNSVFKAYLPCRTHTISKFSRSETYSTIDLVLWNSNYYRYPSTTPREDSPAELRKVYLRYQDTPNHTVTFNIDDSAIIDNGFNSHVVPESPTENTVTLTNAEPFCIKTYSKTAGNACFEVVFGQCMGLDWVRLNNVLLGKIPSIDVLMRRGPDWALSMADAPSRGDIHGPLRIHHLRLPRLEPTCVVRTYRIAWERSKIRLRMEVQNPHLQNGLDEWRVYDVEVSTDFLVHVDYYHHHV